MVEMRTILILLASFDCCLPLLCPLDCYPTGTSMAVLQDF